jgi:hypothetical protein
MTLRSIVSGTSEPERFTGVAAPSSVAAAMYVRFAAYAMNVPADAAREPCGAIQTTTGISDCIIRSMTSRIAMSRPPGVSSWMTTA